MVPDRGSKSWQFSWQPARPRFRPRLFHILSASGHPHLKGSRMKRLIAVALLVSFVSPSLALALDSKGAAYFGGTAAFKEAKDPVDGTLNTKDDSALIFTATQKGYSGQTLAIQY